MLSSDSCLDIACVQAMRHLTANFILEHANSRTRRPGEVGVGFSGVTLEQWLLDSHRYTKSLDEYCKLSVEDMGAEVDESVIELGLVLSALHCSGSMVLLNDFDTPGSTEYEDLTPGSEFYNSLLYRVQVVHTGSVESSRAEGEEVLGHINLCRRSAEVKDISEAFLSTGTAPPHSPGAVEDPVTKYQLAAAQGNAHAAYLLAQHYDVGEDVLQNKVDAAQHYKIAADQGHADAQCMLAMLYDTGDGVEHDSDEAIRYYRMAASRGNVHAQSILGEFHDDSSPLRRGGGVQL